MLERFSRSAQSVLSTLINATVKR